MKIMKKFILLSLISFYFSACVQDDKFDIPNLNCQELWATNTQIDDLLKKISTDPITIEEELVIEGFVVSSDETGNFYKELIIQDQRESPTKGLKISINKANLFNDFPLGSKVLVNAKGLTLGLSNGIPTLGDGLYQKKNPGQIEANVLYNHVDKTCDKIQPIQAKSFENIKALVKKENLNQYIQLNNVYFQNGGEASFHDAKSSFATTNRYLIDSEGGKIAVRTSKYAKFSKETLPKGVGNLKAVLSAYDSNNNGLTDSEYQLTLVSLDDINFDSSIEPNNKNDKNINTYFSCLSEDFQSFETKNENFEKYINYYASDKRKWQIVEFNQNKYIQISAYKASKPVKTYFIIPINFDKADAFSFKTKDGFYNGDALSVYWVNDFSDLKNLRLENDITSEFNISKNSKNSYPSDFVDSGEFNLNKLSGNGAIIFVYSADPKNITTTYQIDDIQIKDNENETCQ
ncbi:Uncharacterised protein [Candidatus Ornithobacterium hominis]|nr:Uncharacterised protein [Candidatus Ornithobacterium hominis]